MCSIDMRRLPFHIFNHRFFALKNPILSFVSVFTIREWFLVRMSVLIRDLPMVQMPGIRIKLN